MTQASGTVGVSRAGDARVIGVISAAHFVAHYYTLLLAPLFVFVRADYGVSYTELGLALTAFNIVSATLQTPAGFLIDRLGPRLPLIGGLLLGASAFAVAGLVHSFLVFVAMFAVAGLGNTVYHPADYALLSHRIAPNRLSHAFSIHTFAGMLGSAVAPPTVLLMQNQWGWRGAFVGAAILGFAVAAVLALQPGNGGSQHEPSTPGRQRDDKSAGWQLLLSPPIMLNLLFFLLLATVNSGVYNYSVAALNAAYGTPAAVANAGLTAFLLLSSLGVLAGGFIASRTTHHSLVAIGGVIITAAAVMLIANIDLGTILLVVVMAAGGFFSGAIMPSRDMIVREVTPPGSFGKVFGFVTTGFNLGGVISPLIFGAIMDHGNPRMVFVVIAAFCLLAIATVLSRPKRAAKSG
ncbi:MAG TPA: MFS transporter [Pseudolabrys sp.]|nr:MFS transporter [Pseudolabrys sp.]